jgi:hypothetical protein
MRAYNIIAMNCAKERPCARGNAAERASGRPEAVADVIAREKSDLPEIAEKRANKVASAAAPCNRRRPAYEKPSKDHVWTGWSTPPGTRRAQVRLEPR